MSIIIALLIAAIFGLIAKLVAGLFVPRYADIIGLLVFLIVLIERLA